MSKVAAKPQSNIDAVIKAEIEARLNLELELQKAAGPILDAIDASDAKLKGLVTDAGHSFKETFEAGTVSVSGRREAERGPDQTILEEVVFNALPAKERKDWLKRGVVKVEEVWSRAYYGRVEVKLFKRAAAA